MKNINCNLCGANNANTDIMFAKNGYNIVKCTHCGLAYVNPQPELQDIKRFYQEHAEYKVHYPPKIKSKFRDARRELKRIRRFKKNVKTIPKLLDIGCSCGFLVKVAQDNNYKAYGIDICEWQIQYAKENLGVKADVENFPYTDLPAEEFDVITMFDVIEHVIDPLESLKECYRLLHTQGILLMGTPDFGHRKVQKQGIDWGHFKPPEHLFYFTCETLKELAQKAGFIYRGKFFKVPWRDGLKVVFEKPNSHT